MNNIGLTENEITLIKNVISSSKATKAVIFGSRAKGNFQKNSDIDIALFGNVTAMEAEEVAMRLELLPLPFMFDVQSFNGINNAKLKEHIVRVGKTLFESTENNTGGRLMPKS
ncbi:hypothetical protein FACS189443_0480 [Planctomycetales bacterium]|nr:hypothetical protein FACS189443_0480 [Planctomycetales bacterium]